MTDHIDILAERVIGLDPTDFIVLKYRAAGLSVREISRIPLMPGREGVRSICNRLSKEFPEFRTILQSEGKRGPLTVRVLGKQVIDEAKKRGFDVEVRPSGGPIQTKEK